MQGDGAPYGVFEVDSRSEGEFSEQDISFLQGAANILGMAIERQRYERNLQAALDYQKILLNEINHRVKNSLQLVASMFSLQAGSTSDTALAQSLQEAMVRVSAVARIHERLYRTANIGTVDLTAYLIDICGDLREVTASCDLCFEPGGPIPIVIAVKTDAMKVEDLSKVIVDTTVQEKATTFPTDAKLLNRARVMLVKLAKKHGLTLRQGYPKVGKRELM